METYYGQDRKNYHTFRLSDEEEVIFRKLMDKYGYTSISSFIRDAILDRKLKVVVYQHHDSEQEMDQGRGQIRSRLPYPWRRPRHHPPPRQQDQTHRRRTRWQVGISDQADWGVA